MSPAYEPDVFRAAADEFNRRSGRTDGAQVVSALVKGLDLVRDLLYLRLHEDVEREVGLDSMLIPVSEIKARMATLAEIECYQVAESSVCVAESNYLIGPSDWFAEWLTVLKLGHRDPACRDRVGHYTRRSADERRLDLTDKLVKVLPEASRAPLVLFRLVPLAVQIVTALAFGDQAGAARARQEQRVALPAIADCPSCRGDLLAVDQRCPRCGSPLWKYELLTSGE